MKNLQAQIPVYPPGEKLEGEGPLGLEGKLSSEGILIFQKIISSAIGVITIIATIWFIVQFITGAVGIISSGGDKAKYEEARSKITNGLIGLVVTIAGIFIIDLFGNLIGIDVLNIVDSILNLIII